MKAYADSSFIVALYIPQESSGDAIRFMQRYERALPFTPWHRLEARNAIRIAVFKKLIESFQAKAQLKQMEVDLREATLLTHEPLDWVDVLRQAEKLGATHNERVGCRSSDLFHVASARKLGCDVFLTFDGKQTSMAKAAGLTVKP